MNEHMAVLRQMRHDGRAGCIPDLPAVFVQEHVIPVDHQVLAVIFLVCIPGNLSGPEKGVQFEVALVVRAGDVVEDQIGAVLECLLVG